MSTKRRRSAIATLLTAAIALLLALPSFASADPLGEINEFGVSAVPVSPSFGPEGKLWFVNLLFPKKLGRFDRTTHEVESLNVTGGAFPTEAELYGVGSGPDGNMWFTEATLTPTEEYIPAIGKIDPTTKTVTHYTSGFAAEIYPKAITAGPDGNMWFTTEGNRIGRITTSGTVTEFTLPEGQFDNFPSRITAGPDGNVWFVTNGPATIGRITPSGEITQFSAGLNAESHLTAITAGPDGNLWFVDQGTGKAVGSITPSGEINEFSVAQTALGITTGPDGKLWFAESSNGVGRIDPTTHAVENFSAGLQAEGNVSEVVAGPGGEENIWFLDLDSGTSQKVGKVGTKAGPKLTVTKTGTGPGGTVVSNPAGIECGATCESTAFAENSKVTLTASPAVNSVFLGWKGCEKGGAIGHTCTVTMDKAKTVEAKFGPTQSLTVGKAGTGTGSVKSSPSGISCDLNCSSNAAAFTEGASVVLTAVPTKSNTFTGWSGAGCSGTGTCTVTMSAAKSVTAEFAATKFNLTLSKAGGGTGAVKSKPASLTCGATCSSVVSSFYEGTEVEVTATPSKGSTLNWSVGSGTCTGSTSPCKVTMSSAKELVAEFK
jgi:streptogramin lyase